MIRAARFADIIRLVEIWKGAHARSRYSRATFDEAEAKRRLFNCIKAHGSPHDGGTWCMVAERRDKIEGFLFGMTDRIEDAGKELFAADWKFIVEPGADARAAMLLRDSFLGWARNHPKVIEIVVGVHDVLGDVERTAALWERKGLKRIGLILGEDMTEKLEARSVA